MYLDPCFFFTHRPPFFLLVPALPNRRQKLEGETTKGIDDVCGIKGGVGLSSYQIFNMTEKRFFFWNGDRLFGFGLVDLMSYMRWVRWIREDLVGLVDGLD